LIALRATLLDRENNVISHDILTHVRHSLATAKVKSKQNEGIS